MKTMKPQPLLRVVLVLLAACTSGDLAFVSTEEVRVFTAGDNACQGGTASQFASCYEPAWGSFNDQTVKTD